MTDDKKNDENSNKSDDGNNKNNESNSKHDDGNSKNDEMTDKKHDESGNKNDGSNNKNDKSNNKNDGSNNKNVESNNKNDGGNNKNDGGEDAGRSERGSPGMKKWKIVKNTVVLSVGFLCLFTAFLATLNLQTSLNKEQGVGAWSVFSIYLSVMVGSLLLPGLTLAWLGCKWTIPLSMLGYLSYIAANFYPVTALMIPTSVLLGLGAGCLWSAQSVYVTTVGVWYSQLTGQNKNDVINYFFGVFFLFYQSAQVWGNLVSSLVFTPDNDSICYNNTSCYNNSNIISTNHSNITTVNTDLYHNYHIDVISRNTSTTPSTTTALVCGAQFCPEFAVAETEASSHKFDPHVDKVYIVIGTFVSFAVLGIIIIIVFLDNINVDEGRRKTERRPSPRLLLSTLSHMTRSRVQLFLVPVTIYNGMERGFFAGDYTKAYVSCSLGIWHVGYAMMTYGVVDALCSLLFGRLVTYVGHQLIFVLAFVTHGSVLTALLLWTPTSDNSYVFYVIAGVWAIGDAVFTSQLMALYGRVFTEKPEAAFATFKVLESLGFVIVFSYNDFLCTDTKLCINIGVLVLAFVGYVAAELTHTPIKDRKVMDIELTVTEDRCEKF